MSYKSYCGNIFTSLPSIFIFAFLVLSSDARAIPIEIKPGAYTGTYEISGAARVAGPTTVELPAGQHNITLAPGNGFGFTIDANGNVTSQAPAAARGGRKSLTFTPITVTVKAGGYTGTYSIRGVDKRVAGGDRPFAVLPGVAGYIVDIARGNSFRFDVAANGNVTSQTPSAAKGGAKAVTFTPIPISVKAGIYTGTYSVRGVDSQPAAGDRPFLLLPGLGGYILDIAPGNNFRFDVTANGDIKSGIPSAAKGGPRTLSFTPITISVKVGAYAGTYSVRGVDGRVAAGDRSFALLPGLGGYIVDIAPNNAFRFAVAANGDVKSWSPSAVKGGPRTLSLKTGTISIDPGDYKGTYSVHGVDDRPQPGVRSFVLMPGVPGYILVISSANSLRFGVDANSVPLPPKITVTSSGAAYVFKLTKVE